MGSGWNTKVPSKMSFSTTGNVSSQAGQHTIPESCTLAFLNLLPSVECLSPRQAMQLMKTERESESSPTHKPPFLPTPNPNHFFYVYFPGPLPFLSSSLPSPLSLPDPSKVVMDKQEFENPHYQRVYQYLRRHIGNISLDRFSYIGNVEGTTTNCLEIILQ